MSLRLQYARPRNLDQAVAILDGLSAGAMIIAGGQELMPHLNYGRISPSVFVDIGAIAALKGIVATDDGIAIGALTPHRDIQDSPEIREMAPLLAYSAAQIGGGWQVHNRGTIGGNIVSMHPLYDIVPALLALDARIEIANQQETRTLTAAELVTETSHQLGTASILTRVIVPSMPASCGWAYEKLKQTEGCYGSANAAALIGLDSNGRLETIRLVIGAVSEKTLDLSDTLADQIGNEPGGPDLAAAIDAACAAAVTQPLDDQQGHGAYRQAMSAVVGKRAVAAAIKSAGR